MGNNKLLPKIRVYYDELDGKLYPKLILLPNQPVYQQKLHNLQYTLQSPFERMHQEDFHDDLKIISVSQGALKQSLEATYQFHLNLEQLKKDLEHMHHDPDAVYETDYFSVLVDELEELLSYDVITRFLK